MPAELTAESRMSMNNTVIIPTAGLGSRLGELSRDLNKSLLPYKGKPVLAHIIDQFPKNTRFIIPTGYKSELVKDFCALAYADRHIEFVDIDDYSSAKAGPGYTIRQCLPILDGPFWYIPCDTYFSEDLTRSKLTEDTYFAKHVIEQLSSEYTMFSVDNDCLITDYTFKQPQSEEWIAFTGVMYINDWQKFKHRLSTSASPEIIWTIEIGSKVALLESWLDFGNREIYEREQSRSQKYDFSKQDELTYFCNNRVIKWWADQSIAIKKYQKYLTNSLVCPAECQWQGQWIAYDYYTGQVVYDNHSPEILANMLNWLKQDVWKFADEDLRANSLVFYKIKTNERIRKFFDRYPELSAVKSVNGIAVKDWKYYRDSIDWELLINENLPAFTHGDLHFDNVIIDSSADFKVIDWRHEFAGSVEVGDIYYDLAKLTGGFIIDYSKIKQNDFVLDDVDGDIKLDIPSVQNCGQYITMVKDFTIARGWNYRKVQMLVPLIFWNMAPLHTPPFDKFLWYLGLKLFEELS